MRIGLKALVATLILAGTFAAGWELRAQSAVISGSDVGFRLDATWTRVKGKPIGVWVVRYDGKWVEPEDVPRAKSITLK